MGFKKIILAFIFIIFLNIGYASSWIEGNKLTLQGLDKITARIETFGYMLDNHINLVFLIFLLKDVFFLSL